MTNVQTTAIKAQRRVNQVMDPVMINELNPTVTLKFYKTRFTM